MLVRQRPRLTVLIITYNHGAYIRKAMESVLMQRMADQFEVIVADDNSVDDTRKIIDEVLGASAAPPPVCYLDHTVNRGVTENYRRSFAACKTEYVAVIEGDDYWAHPDKLSMQATFLDEHLECSAVSANYFVYDEKSCRYTPRSDIDGNFRYLDARALIADNLIGNFSTCMYRLSALRAIPELLYSETAYDWGVNICVARNGLIGFLHTPLSVYRVHNKGTWNRLSKQERIGIQLQLLQHYNRCTDMIFDEEFRILTRRLRRSLISFEGNRSWVHRIIAVLIACVPLGVIDSLKLLGRVAYRLLLPPIIPIALKKLRKGLS